MIGYVLKDQVLASIVDGHTERPLESLKREIIAVPEDYPILELFNRLSAHEQMPWSMSLVAPTALSPWRM